MGSYLAKPVCQKQREDGLGPAHLRFGAASMQGWRISQEDAHIALPRFDTKRKLALFGVFDGHCGGMVSQLVAEELPKQLRKAPSFQKGKYSAALRETFLDLDRYLDSLPARRIIRKRAEMVQAELACNFTVEDAERYAAESGLTIDDALEQYCSGDPDETGCTAVVALLHYGSPVMLHVANCGDSRAVLWNKTGHAIAMSKDHKPLCKEERSRVEAAGGWVTSEGRIEGNLNLSRALGDFDYKRTRKRQRADCQMISGVPDVRFRQLKHSDQFLFLGCDGVWETSRSSKATVDAVRELLPSNEKAPLSRTISRFFDANISGGDSTTGLGMDNMTAVLVRLPEIAKDAAAKAQRASKQSSEMAAHLQKDGGVRRKICKRPSARGP